jgi:hypothetical protein
LPQKFFSFTPGFSLVLCGGHFSGTVLTVSARKKGKPLKRFSALVLREDAGLKPGVNERDF